MNPSGVSPRSAYAIECSRVDLPEPFSPVSMMSGCERSTIIGMWKFRLVKTGWARICKYINFQNSKGPRSLTVAALSQVALQIVRTISVRPGRFPRNPSRSNEIRQRLLHRHHSLAPSRRYLRPKLVIVALADEGADRVGGDHDLRRRPAGRAIDSRDELLRDHRGQRERELLADLRLIACRKRVQDARHCLDRVVGMKRGEHQVAGLRGGQRRRDGLRIAHLAH